MLGAHGILGSGFRASLSRQSEQVIRVRPPWAAPDELAAHLTDQISVNVAHDGETAVLWAAGVGQIGSSAAQLRMETAGVQALCVGLRQLSARQAQRFTVLFASSAGALYGGCGSAEIDDAAMPVPTTAYGREKLVQEGFLRQVSLEMGIRVIICRYSNLFGLADGRLTPRGLVSTAVRSTRLRQPMTIYVNSDTRRDYLFNVDAAAISLRLLGTAPAGVTTALVRDGSTRTVSEVMSIVGRVCGRRVPAQYADRAETRFQPRVLRFSRPPTGADQVRRTPMEAAIHLMVRAPMSP